MSFCLRVPGCGLRVFMAAMLAAAILGGLSSHSNASELRGAAGAPILGVAAGRGSSNMDPGSSHLRKIPKEEDAEPILVRVRVGSEQAWGVLRSLGAKLYLRGDGTAVVRMNAADLPSLESFGLPWRLLSIPKPGPLYYMVPGRGAPSLPSPGLQVIEDDGEGTIVTADPGAVKAARELGYLTIPLDREWPMWPSGFLDIEFVHDVVARDPSIYNLTRLVSEDTLRSYVKHLQDFGTRHSDSIEIMRAGQWLVNTLGRFGYPDTLFEVLEGPRGEVAGRPGNVTGSRPGSTRPQFRVLVGGHYDSTARSGDDAPGADDNASGTAAGLEIARLLASKELDATVEYVFFSQEEQGLVGSWRYATQLHLAGVPTSELCFINMDMIGNSDNLPWRIKIYANAPSLPLALLTARVAEAYTEAFPVMAGFEGGSDHVSLQQAGYPAIFVHENDFSVVYHSRWDLLSYMEMDYMAEVVRMVLATVLHLARIADPPTDLIASTTETGEVLAEWTHSSDADVIGYQVEVLDAWGEVLTDTFTSENYIVLSSDSLMSGAMLRVRAEDVLGEGDPSDAILIDTGQRLASKAFPNPALEGARFQVYIPGSGSPVDGELDVVDAAGRLVYSMRYNGLDRGTHVLEWGGKSSGGEAVPSGVYFYLFKAAGVGSHGGKLMVLR